MSCWPPPPYTPPQTFSRRPDPTEHSPFRWKPATRSEVAMPSTRRAEGTNRQVQQGEREDSNDESEQNEMPDSAGGAPSDKQLDEVGDPLTKLLACACDRQRAPHQPMLGAHSREGPLHVGPK